MNPEALLETAAWLLALTALGGLLMALLRTRRATPPHWLAMAHGFLAAAGLTLLLYAAWTVGLPPLMGFGVLALVAAAGAGVYINLHYHLRGQALPVTWIVVHGFVAAVGLALVALGAFGPPPAIP